MEQYFTLAKQQLKRLKQNYRMKQYFVTVRKIVWKRKGAFIASLLSVAFFYSIFTGISSGKLWPPTFYGFFVSSYSLPALIIISLLSAVLITLQIHGFKLKMKTSRKTGFMGFVGIVGSFFVSACPFCKPILISLLGLGAAGGVIAGYGTQLTVLAAIFLLASIILVTKNIQKKGCEECK